MRTTIEMAREAAGAASDWALFREFMPEIHKLAELVRADERARMAEQPAQQQEPICKLFGTLPVYDRAAQQEQNRQIDQLIQERDHRDEIIDKLCDAVLGPDRYEWSSQYFFEDAVREVEERMAEQPAQQEQESWEDLHNALQRIDTAAVGLPTFEVRHEGGLDAVTQNIVDAITALHTQPAQQEPVTDKENEKFRRDVSNFAGADPEATKYALEEFLKNRTSPPEQRTWAGLTDEEREAVINNSMTPACVAIAIEAKLKEKNT